MSLTDLMSMAKPNLESREKILVKLIGKELLNCFQCIKCTSGCTALKLLELKPHEIVKLVSLGFVDELASSDIIWTCVTCLKCLQRCPRKASPYHVIIALRNLAVEREAKVPEGYLKAVSQIIETGLAESVQKVVTKKMETFDREGLKLPRITLPKESFQATFMKVMEER
ncbi:MAG: 4Fe-4S dicluster domain-containing protein [Candidatus Bathyarchaeota archaeon]|nr:4Fe-4S dicluster domain-containing protein [Candidatus Bathyarchaeota archaeon]MDH5787102.1 4Fe-4S dicluster domain-containing protein [Candidatus Bathyarchaeota archaeon]